MDRRALFRRPAPAPSPAPAPPEMWPRPPGSPEAVELMPGAVAPAGVPIAWGGGVRSDADRAAGRRGGAVANGVTPGGVEAVAPGGAEPLSALRTDAGLEPYRPTDAAPWGRERAVHLLHRVAYGATPALVDDVVARGPGAVDALLDATLGLPAPPRFGWYDEPFPAWDSPEYRAFEAKQNDRLSDVQWDVYETLLGARGRTPWEGVAYALRERLALMWSNHFVTEQDVYYFSPLLHRYWDLLRRNALGDFRAFVHEVGLTPAMLVYLDGARNRKQAPNENYARELLELFTVGITDASGAATYTQADVEGLARALTGWTVQIPGDTSAAFVPQRHDTTDKTVLGQTGPWGYDDAVRILFEERPREIARTVAVTLYREFVYDVPHPAVVAEMADLLVQEGFQIAPVVRALLRSAHFFDAAAIRARIKSPAERTFGLWRTLGYAPDREQQGWLWFQLRETQQVLFKPWTVAGWPGGRAWIDTSTLPLRWSFDGESVWFHLDRLRPLALALPDPGSAEATARHLAGLLLGREPAADALAVLTEVLLDGLPPYEWDPRADGSEYRLRALVDHLVRLPEFQLT